MTPPVVNARCLSRCRSTVNAPPNQPSLPLLIDVWQYGCHWFTQVFSPDDAARYRKPWMLLWSEGDQHFPFGHHVFLGGNIIHSIGEKAFVTYIMGPPVHWEVPAYTRILSEGLRKRMQRLWNLLLFVPSDDISPNKSPETCPFMSSKTQSRLCAIQKSQKMAGAWRHPVWIDYSRDKRCSERVFFLFFCLRHCWKVFNKSVESSYHSVQDNGIHCFLWPYPCVFVPTYRKAYPDMVYLMRCYQRCVHSLCQACQVRGSRGGLPTCS